MNQPPSDFEGELCQIGIVVKDLEAGMARYSAMLGVSGWKRLDTDYRARFRQWEGRIANRNAFAALGNIHVELVEPGVGEGIAKEWLQRRGEGIFHLAFGTGDLWQRPGGAEVIFANLDRVQHDGHPEIVMLDTEAELGWYMELMPQSLAVTMNARIRSDEW